ncbi:MAG: hypothetical protein J6A50_06080 [Clostridia bacterium]|nr:hypothetical protein [Clostridia bacterium]
MNNLKNPAETLAELNEIFENPGAEYRGKPFWSWNGELEKDEVLRQIEIMKEMGFGGYFMHSRSGLITEYLGDRWFEIINAAADKGEELGLEAWLYDEDRWPSGSAGGIASRDEKYRMKSVFVYEITREKFVWTEDVMCAFVAKLEGVNMACYEPITKETDVMGDAFEGMTVLKFAVVKDAPHSVFNGATYIDTMMPEAVDKFIEVTHDEYVKRCGDRIGKSIKGIFTDEPHRGALYDKYYRDENGFMCSPVCYTDDIFEEFEKRYGYDAKGRLPELFYKNSCKGTRKLKHDYIDLACNLFTERFAKRINDWCEEHGITFTGHGLHENALMYQTVPSGSLMRLYENMGMPGIDLLCEEENAYWVAKQVQSVARQLGQKWILSELYGCTGWHLDFKAHKGIGDWQALYGVNVRCPHLSWYTMEGEAKRDYPASILHQSPFYKDYNYIETYFARFGAAMSAGKPLCEVLVLNPIESIWMGSYAGWSNWMVHASPDAIVIDEHYMKLFDFLQSRHIDFDYGEELLMKEHGKVCLEKGEAVLRVGEMAYRVLVVSGAVTVRESTLKLIEEFVSLGGKVIIGGNGPAMVDCEESDAFKELAEKYPDNVICTEFEGEAVEKAIRPLLKVNTSASDTRLRTQARVCEESGAVIAAVINLDRNNEISGATFTLEGAEGIKSVEEWSLRDGGKRDITAKCEISEGRIIVNTSFDPCGERVFVFLKEKSQSTPCEKKLRVAEKGIIAEEHITGYSLDEKNVLVLDFAEYKFLDGEWQPPTEVLKVDRNIRDELKIERRSGNMLQPWYAKKYANDVYGPLELRFEFYIDEMPSGEVKLAGERPELFEYAVNDVKLSADGEFWVDICFKTMPVPKEALKLGRNVITAKTVFGRTTNVEALYLLGDFGVKIAEHEQNVTVRHGEQGKGRFFGNEKHITALPENIGFDNLAKYGLPFYSGCVTYKINSKALPEVNPRKGERLFIGADNFVGALVKVSAEGKEILLPWKGQMADVTELSGKDISVILVCTRKNTFGPLHLVPAIPPHILPDLFVTDGEAFSEDYVLMDSGIFGGIKFEKRVRED